MFFPERSEKFLRIFPVFGSLANLIQSVLPFHEQTNPIFLELLEFADLSTFEVDSFIKRFKLHHSIHFESYKGDILDVTHLLA